MLLCHLLQLALEVPDARVDIIAVHRVDAHCKVLLRIFRHRTRRRAQKSNVRLHCKFCDVVGDLDACERCGRLCVRISAHKTDHLKILGCPQRFHHIFSNISVSDNCCFYHGNHLLDHVDVGPLHHLVVDHVVVAESCAVANKEAPRVVLKRLVVRESVHAQGGEIGTVIIAVQGAGLIRVEVVGGQLDGLALVIKHLPLSGQTQETVVVQGEAAGPGVADLAVP